MKAPGQPADEDRRLAALRRYDVLHPAPDPALDDLVALAAHVCSAPMSLISIVGERRQWPAARTGLPALDIPREVSFCGHVLQRCDLLVVTDAAVDARFAGSPLVTGEPAIRFYAGTPLTAPGGDILGTLCVMDRMPRQLSAAQEHALRALGKQVMTHLELRRKARELGDRERRLRAILDTEPECMKLLDADGSLLEMNPAGLRMIEADSFPQVEGRCLYDLVVEEQRPAVRRLTEKVFAGESGVLQFEVTGLKGGRRWLETHATPLRDDAGSVTALLGITRDITERKRAEEQLREGEERFSKVFYSSPAALVVARLSDRRILDVNAAFESITGHPRQDCLGRPIAHLGMWIVDEHGAPLASLLKDGSIRNMEFRFRNRAGEERVGLGSVECVQLWGEAHLVASVIDVTDRKRAESRIVKLNRVYAMLSGVNEHIVRERDPFTMLSGACRIAVDAGGFGMAWIGLLDPSSGRLAIRAHASADADTLAFIHSLIAADPPAGCDFTASTLRTGEHAVCDDVASDPRAAAWRDAVLERGFRSLAAFPLTVQDNVIGSFNIYAAETGVFDSEELRLLDRLAADISLALEVHEREQERRRAEAERHAAEERLRQVVENIQEVFWITDPSRRKVLYVSPAYDMIWGRTCASLYESPQSWADAIHPEDRERVMDASRTKQESGDYDETYRIVRPDGSVRWIRDRAFPIRNAAGDVHRIVGTAMDITAQRHLEDQFRQAQKMETVGRLAGGIAHDFNNLLTVINGMADLAISNLRERDPLRGDLEEIRLAGDRAAALTRQLLALSRQQLLKPELLDLNIVLREMESMLRRLIGEDVTLVFKLSDDLGTVKADPGQMEQVILNLAVNARDAMPDGGTLTIESRNVDRDETATADWRPGRRGPQVLIAVSDTGVGMDERTRQRIFEPFFTTKEPGKGTGLGLSTVYGIVDQSGGSISVDSEPGRGTTFYVYLPKVGEKLRDELPVLPLLVPRGAETILLVEDEQGVRNLTKRVLTSAGYTVLEAANGAEALKLLEQYALRVHLMVTDVVMPGMNGRELAARVAQIRKDVSVLYTSGYTDDEIFRHGVLDDASRFINKPYSPAEIRQRVRDILDQR